MCVIVELPGDFPIRGDGGDFSGVTVAADKRVRRTCGESGGEEEEDGEEGSLWKMRDPKNVNGVSTKHTKGHERKEFRSCHGSPAG